MDYVLKFECSKKDKWKGRVFFYQTTQRIDQRGQQIRLDQVRNEQ